MYFCCTCSKRKPNPPTHTHTSAILSVAVSFHFSSSSITRNTQKKINFLLFCVCMAPDTELPDEYMAISSSGNSTQISEQSWSTTQFLSPWHWEVKLQIYGTKDKDTQSCKVFFTAAPAHNRARAICSGTSLVLLSSGHNNAQMKTEQTTVITQTRMCSVPNRSLAFKSGIYLKPKLQQAATVQTLIPSA